LIYILNVFIILTTSIVSVTFLGCSNNRITPKTGNEFLEKEKISIKDSSKNIFLNKKITSKSEKEIEQLENSRKEILAELKDIERLEKLKNKSESDLEKIDQKEILKISLQYIQTQITVVTNSPYSFEDVKLNFCKNIETKECLQIQGDYSEFSTYDYLDSFSNEVINKTINYLYKIGDKENLSKVIAELQKHQISKISPPLNWIGNPVFGLNIDSSDKQLLKLDIYYLKDNQVNIHNTTFNKNIFKNQRTIKPSDISNNSIIHFEKVERIALAYIFENYFNKYIGFKSPQKYINENKIYVYLDGKLTENIPFLYVREIKPKLDEVDFYLRDNRYHFRIREEFQDKFQFSNGTNSLSVKFPRTNKIYIISK